MNIFALSSDPISAAQDLVDTHCTKMVVESAQMLANCFSVEQLSARDCPRTASENVRKHSFVLHPCSIWTRKTRGNMRWLITHAIAMDQERVSRFNNGNAERIAKQHFSLSFILWCQEKIGDAELILSNSEEVTEFAQAMPQELMQQDSVAAYRNYYRIYKKHLHSWRNRSAPAWIINEDSESK